MGVAWLMCMLFAASTGLGGTDSNLVLSARVAGSNMVMSWFGSNAVAYQAETSSDLANWTNSGSVITGAGAFLFVTNPINGQSRSFVRVKQAASAGVISADFDSLTGALTIVGDDLDNAIIVSRNTTGAILVNNGAVPIQGGAPTVATTLLIQIFGRAGNDRLGLDEFYGALPRANLYGEAGNDMLWGGSGADVLNGGTGSDTLLGMGGADSLIEGDDDDTVVGGDGDDAVQLGGGNDRFTWNPGDDSDVIEGGDGLDTVEVNGGNGAEAFTATANGSRVRFDRLDPAPFALDIGACEDLALNANSGNDSFSATGNLAALIQIRVDGGAGDDTLLGSNGADVLLGGDGNDFVDGNQGADVVFLGAGEDVFQWDPGDGNDTVEGQTGNDTLVFNGSAGNEILDLSAHGARSRLTRNVGNITLDLAGIETIEAHALGGTDLVAINDLWATEITAVNVHLAGLPGSNSGDLLVDTLMLQGTEGVDGIVAAQTGSDLTVTGLKPLITVFNGETNDVLIINGLGGNDTINASGIVSLFASTLNGGAGDDTLIGSSRADVLLGGDDHDLITSRSGNDLIFGGNGDDTIVWNPGDGSDVLEGQSGTDTLVFNGSNAAENMDASANGSRLRFFRDVGNVTLDCDDVEAIQVNLTGGVDSFTSGELTTTDVNVVVVDLGGSGGGDLQPDSIIIHGSQGSDTIMVSGSPGSLVVMGLSASVTITNGELANDSLVLNALGGDDLVDASGLAAAVIKFSLNGGLGADTLIGSSGDDVITGGDGNDLILAGAGNDAFIWNPGDDNDTIEGQAGVDTLVFNGANVSEIIDLSANGSRLRFFRNVASVVTDCNDVETVRFEALGGADVITLNDLSGTGVTAVNINLASTLGGNTGDGQPDSLIVNGSGREDVVTVYGSAGSVSLLGLAATVTLSGSEAANDRLILNTLAGDDVVDASALPAGIITLTADGGEGQDVLTGSGGADVLLGGDGDDVLIGGPGVDVLDGGPGDNIVIQ